MATKKTTRKTDAQKLADEQARLKAFRERAAKLRAEQKARERKRRGTPLRKTSAFAQAQYAERLKTVRKYVEGFDSPSLSPSRMAKVPADPEAKRKRARERARVNRAFRKLRPYIARPQKTVSVKGKGKKARAALVEYSGLPKLKNLKAVPVPTIAPDKAKVTVTRKGQVRVQAGEYVEREYLFPRKPKTPDDVEAMAEALVKKLPPGYYVVLTNVRELLPTAAARGLVMNEVRRILLEYNARSPGLIRSIRGLKFVGAKPETAAKRIRETRKAREESREMRRNVWQDVAEMAKKTREKKRKAWSKRARLTGRA